MADPYKLIRSTNLEYARLLRDIVKRHSAFSELLEGKTTERLASEEKIRLPTPLGLASPFQYVCISAFEDVCSFWIQNQAAYLEAVKAIPVMKLSVTWEPCPRHLLYFDTIVCADVMPALLHPKLEDRTYAIVCSIYRSCKILPWLEADADLPLAVLKPASLGVDSAEQFYKNRNEGTLHDQSHQAASELTEAFLGRVAKDLTLRTIAEWSSLNPKGRVDLSRWFDQRLLSQVLEADLSQARPYADRAVVDKDAFNALAGNVSDVSNRSFQLMIVLIEAIFYNVTGVEEQGRETNADVFVESPKLHGLIAELRGRKLSEEFRLDEEQVAAWCLSTDDFQLIDIDQDTIIRFREKGGPGILRSALREQRNVIKAAPYSQLNVVSANFVAAIKLRLDAHADEMQALISSEQALRQSLISKVLALGSMTALSLMVPPLVGAAASLVYSAPTLKDIWDQNQAALRLHQEIELIRDEPLGIFEKALGPGRPIFRWPWSLQ